MIPFDLYQAVKKRLAEEILSQSARIAKGHWKSEAEGKQMCGVVAGLHKAGELLLEEYEKFEKLEDDEVDE